MLIEILTPRTNAMIDAIKQAYETGTRMHNADCLHLSTGHGKKNTKKKRKELAIAYRNSCLLYWFHESESQGKRCTSLIGAKRERVVIGSLVGDIKDDSLPLQNSNATWRKT